VKIPNSLRQKTSLAYYIDYYKASSSQGALSVLDGKSIHFNLQPCLLVVEGTTDPLERYIHPSDGESSPNIDAHPTLSRRHSTASFKTQCSLSTPSPAPCAIHQEAGRRLNHSRSEINFKKKEAPTETHFREEAPAEDTSSNGENVRESRLSPFAQPFNYSGTSVSVETGNVASRYHHSGPVIDSLSYEVPQYTSATDNSNSIERFQSKAPTVQIHPSYPHMQTLYSFMPQQFSTNLTPSPSNCSSPGSIIHGHHPSYSNTLRNPELCYSPPPPFNVHRVHRVYSGLVSPINNLSSPGGSNGHAIPTRNALDLAKIERGEDTRTVSLYHG
jgi:hypothetical protein